MRASNARAALAALPRPAAAYAAVHGQALLLAGGWTDADATIARSTWPGAHAALAAPGTRLDFAHGAVTLSLH